MHHARISSAFGDFPIAPRRSFMIGERNTIPGVNAYVLPPIPQTFDALCLQLQASCDTATRFVRLRWSADNGANFFTTGAVGYVRDGASTVTQVTSGDLAFHAAMAAASVFTANIFLYNYADPYLPLMVEGRGTVDFTTSWKCQTADLFRYTPLNALQLIWNSTGVFDGISNYRLIGYNY